MAGMTDRPAPPLVLASASPARLGPAAPGRARPRGDRQRRGRGRRQRPDPRRAGPGAGRGQGRRRWPRSPRSTGALVIGCDSVLDLDGEALGKPADAEEATARWKSMRGRAGMLRTGHCVDRHRDRPPRLGDRVHRRPLRRADDAEIAAYVASRRTAARGGRVHPGRPLGAVHRRHRRRPRQRHRPLPAAAAPPAGRTGRRHHGAVDAPGDVTRRSRSRGRTGGRPGAGRRRLAAVTVRRSRRAHRHASRPVLPVVRHQRAARAGPARPS